MRHHAIFFKSKIDNNINGKLRKLSLSTIVSELESVQDALIEVIQILIWNVTVKAQPHLRRS